MRLLPLLIFACGCFLTHGRGSRDREPDASVDAAVVDVMLEVDASLDAGAADCEPASPELFGACPLDDVHWWWDGSDCVTGLRGSCCDGPDCARTYGSRVECFAAYRECGASTPMGTHWVFERRDVEVEIAECGEVVYAMDTAYVEAHIGIYDTCERAGPVERVIEPDGAVRLIGRVWRRVNEDGSMPEGCDPVTARETRALTIPFDGAFSLVVRGDHAEVEIEGHGIALECGADKPEGASCNGGCECGAGMECVPALRDGGCHGFACAYPCEDAGGACSESQACDRLVERSVPVCVEREPPCEGACALPTDVGAHLEYRCVTDDDCGGASCAETAEGVRECVVPCWTRHGRCPGSLACPDAPPEDGLWTCQ